MAETPPNRDQDTADLRQTSQEWLRKGNDLVGRQHYEEALAAYEQALHFNPSDARIYVNKGVALGELGLYEESLTAYEQALHLSPNDSRIYVNKGAALDEWGRYEEALAAYDQALRLKPDDGLSWYNKGNSFLHLERYEEALAAYDQALLWDSNDARFYGNKAGVLDKLGRLEEALVAYDQALLLNPQYVPALVGKGVVLEQLGRSEEALAAYDQALHLDPNQALIWVNKGNRLLHLERYEQALAAYEQALSLAPEDAKAFIGRKRSLEKLGRSEQGVASAHQSFAEGKNPHSRPPERGGYHDAQHLSVTHEEYQTMTTSSLPFPKIFRSRTTGRYHVLSLFMLIGGIGLLILAGVLLRLFIIAHPPLPLLLGSVLLLLVLVLLAGLLLRGYYFIRASQIILTSEGILYNAVSFKMYTPWKNAIGIGGVTYGISFKGLVLHEPAVMERKVSEGIQQGIAVIELTRFMIAKNHFKQRCPFTHILPVDIGLVGTNWLQGEFGFYLRSCAPQVFEHRRTT